MKWFSRHKFALAAPLAITFAAALLGIVTSPFWIVAVIAAAGVGDSLDRRVRPPRPNIEARMRELEAEEAAKDAPNRPDSTRV
jgi:hypothetical protein